MPFQIGSVAIHNDGQHTGSAARNSASGVKGIDASQNLTPKVVMADINSAILNAANGIAGLDASSKVAVGNLPTNVANGVAGLDASSKVAVGNLPTNVANGVAGLDASSKFAGLLATDPGVISTTVTWSGNNTTNRALAHNMSRVPKLVIITSDQATTGYTWYKIHLSGYIHAIHTTADGKLAITAPDATNIYVGNATSYDTSANLTGVNYTAIIFG